MMTETIRPLEKMGYPSGPDDDAVFTYYIQDNLRDSVCRAP